MKKYSAYNNDPELKQKLIVLSVMHRQQDQYIKGTFGEENIGEEVFKGCSVGCSVVDVCQIRGIELKAELLSDHAWLAEQLDVPVFITKLQDCIFEGVSDARRETWTTDFFSAINTDSDISLVLPKFLKFVLEGVLQYVQDERYALQKDAINGSILVMRNWIDTGQPDHLAADAADAAAKAAAKAADASNNTNAAYAASYAAKVANADADAAPYAAAYAGYAAADTAYAASNDDYAAYAAAHEDLFDTYADTLIDLIRAEI
jgi:hypothetical protein